MAAAHGSRHWRLAPLLRASVGLHAAAAAAATLPGMWPWSVGVLAANHALLTATGLWPRSNWLGPNLVRLPRTADAPGRQIALTFDDGPDPEITPALLDLLEQHQARATFFCIGERVRRHPRIAREIQRRGHHLENHSEHHPNHFSLLGVRGLRREIGDAQDSITDTCGRPPRLFRAPAGLRSPLLDPVLQTFGLRLASWTRRGFDTRAGAAQPVLARLLPQVTGGSILLLHDGNCAITTAGRPLLLDVLPPLLAAIEARALVTVRLADALDAAALPVSGVAPHGPSVAG